nr:retrovirus-related Pol polyprotein from transposon TNT 1-94 [Tanacetum cinerariifolium]
DSSVALTAFVDVDHASCQDTRCSTSGSLQFLGERLIRWSLKRRKSAAISNYSLGFHKIPMYCDNKSAIALRCNNVQRSRSKHIDIRYHIMKEKVKNEVIELYFVNTEYQLADLFTKALGRDRIEFLINKLGMKSFTPETLKQLTDEVDETMDTTIDQQVAMEEAFVPHTHRLRIGRSNFCLLSNISSKESTLQLVYDVLRLTPFFKAFLVTADVSEIYMQEFWVIATVHHHSIRLPGQSFVEPPFKEEIMAFLRFLGHSGAIRRLTDVEHKDTKKSNEMYYHRFTKVIIHHFVSKDPSIPRRNKVNWHYVRDDHMFTTIKLVSRHHNTQQFDAMLPIELTNVDIRNSDAYKEYYAVTTGATPPKTKASVQKTRSSSDTKVTPPTTAAGLRLSTSSKGKQLATTSKANSLTALSKVVMTEAQQLKLATKRSLQQTHISQASGSGIDERTSIVPEVLDVPTEGSDEEISWRSSDEGDDDDDEEVDDGETRDEESFDPIPKTPENTDDEGNGEENLGINVGREEGQDEEFEEDELYRDVNINLGKGIQMADVHTTQEFEDSHVTLTLTPTSVAPLPVFAPTLTYLTIATISTTLQEPNPSTTAPSILLRDLLNFGSLFGFDHRLKTLELNFSEFMQTNQFAGAISSILGITVNEQIEAKVLTRSSNSSKTYYVVATDLSEMELKKIIIKKMEGNKSIHQSNEQRNLYKALFEAYESDKIILDTYGDTVTLKRRRDDDADKDEEPSAGSDQGSKRRREVNEPYESATVEEPMQTTHEMEEPSHPEFETGADDQPIVESSQHPEWFSQQKKPPTPDHDWNKTLPATHESIQLKTKATDYGHIKWIEVLVPRTMWIQEPIGYDKHTLWGISQWGRKGQQFYGFAVNRESTRDVYLKRRIIAVIELKIVEGHNYKHLDWITVPRDDDKLYKFKEGDFKRLRVQDIEYMLLLLNKDKQNRLMWIDELHKFSDGTLTDVRTALDDCLKGIRMKYMPQTI